MGSMFTPSGAGVAVSLLYREGTDNFVVRETIPAKADSNNIREACERMLSTMAFSYASYKAHEGLTRG